MKTLGKIFKLYSFDELDEKIQNIVIFKWIENEIEIMNEDSLFYDCVIKMEQMRTPWFLASCIYEEHKEDIIGIIDANDCLFLKNGDPFDYIDCMAEGGEL